MQGKIGFVTKAEHGVPPRHNDLIRGRCANDLDPAYNQGMARGWESKSIEAQQEEASEKSASPKTRLTPAEAALERERDSLRLARHRVIQQLESSQDPRHRTLLQSALASLDEKLGN